MTWGAIAGAGIGAAASLGAGLASGSPEQPRQYPELKKNKVMALALARMLMGAPKYDWNNLPSAPAAPGLPNFAATLAKAREVA